MVCFVAVELARLSMELSDGGKVGGLLFADYFVRVSESGEQLQRVIDVVHSYCQKWRLKAIVSKSAEMTFVKGSVEGSWKWEQDLSRVSKYTCLGIDFAESGAWDMLMEKVVDSGKRSAYCEYESISHDLWDCPVYNTVALGPPTVVGLWSMALVLCVNRTAHA